MALIYSAHWMRKRHKRPTITDDIIEYSALRSAILKDKRWTDALNAVCRVPPSGRILKVVYKRLGGLSQVCGDAIHLLLAVYGLQFTH
jgi:hypothetical protein